MKSKLNLGEITVYGEKMMTCSYKNCKEQPKKKLFGGYRKMCAVHLCYFRDIMRKRAKEKVRNAVER